MRVTEQQLYKMICESINNALMEANGPDVVGTFTSPTKKPIKTGGDVLKSTVKHGASGYLINEHLPLALAYLTGAVGTGAKLCILLGNLGMVYTAGHLAQNIANFVKLKNLTLPKHFAFAVSPANHAVDLRAEAQEMVIESQQNVHASLDAWHQYYPNEKLEWQDIQAKLKERGIDVCPEIRNVNGQGKRKILPDINGNFMDKYKKLESTKKNKLVESNGGQTSVGKYLQMFKTNDPNKDGGEGFTKNLSTVLALSTTFISCHKLWAEYTNYIDALVERFKDNGLTWENVLDKTNRTTLGRIAASLVNSIGNGKFGETVMPMQKRKKREVRQQGSEIVLRVISYNYNEKIQNNKLIRSYILFRQERTNHYFQIPNVNDKGQRILNVQNGEGYKLNYSPILLDSSKNAVSANGVKIFGLKQDAIDMLEKIDDTISNNANNSNTNNTNNTNNSNNNGTNI